LASRVGLRAVGAERVFLFKFYFFIRSVYCLLVPAITFPEPWPMLQYNSLIADYYTSVTGSLFIGAFVDTESNQNQNQREFKSLWIEIEKNHEIFVNTQPYLILWLNVEWHTWPETLWCTVSVWCVQWNHTDSACNHTWGICTCTQEQSSIKLKGTLHPFALRFPLL